MMLEPRIASSKDSGIDSYNEENNLINDNENKFNASKYSHKESSTQTKVLGRNRFS